MEKKASAVWRGKLKDGIGSISTETGVLRNAPYGFAARFEGGKGTNPEELIGAAHAACFSMALSMALGEAGLVADLIETHATVTLEKTGAGYEILSSNLSVVAQVPGAIDEQFALIATRVKNDCPVSRVLKARVTLDARLAAWSESLNTG